MTIRELQQIRARQYRSDQSGGDAFWFRDITDALNMLPPMSVFSFGNPNSNLSAIPGTLGLNITSAATSKIWIKQVGSGNTGWTSVLTGTVNETLRVVAGGGGGAAFIVPTASRFYLDGGDNTFIEESSNDNIGFVTNGLTRMTVGNTALSMNVPVRLKNYTVATLPAGAQGDVAFVTDALAPAFLTAVVGGGAVVTPVFYDGTNWVAI